VRIIGNEKERLAGLAALHPLRVKPARI